jgi:hypothetical protein
MRSASITATAGVDISQATISQSTKRGHKIAQTIGLSLYEKFNQ